MYQRTTRAGVWAGPEEEPRGTASTGKEPGAAQDETIWAKVPYQTRRGRCLAVRRKGETLLVGIAASPAVQWLPAKQVLTDEEASRWAASGF